MTNPWHITQVNAGATRFETDDARLSGSMSRLAPHKSGPNAFSFQKHFPTPGEAGGPADMHSDP